MSARCNNIENMLGKVRLCFLVYTIHLENLAPAGILLKKRGFVRTHAKQ